MKQLQTTAFRVTAIVAAIAGLCMALAGCSFSGGMAANVTSGKALPIFHQQAGQLSPAQQAAKSRANRNPGP